MQITATRCAWWLLAWLGHLAAATGSPPFFPGPYDVGEECAWIPPTLTGLRVGAHYIGGPVAGENRDAWVSTLRDYRDLVRNGGYDHIVSMDYHGVRAWVRLAVPVAKAYDLRPSEPLHVTVTARWISGHSDLCIAFDTHERGSDGKSGWTGIKGVLAVPQDGQWHELATTVTVPSFDSVHLWLRPIFGMDAAHDSTPGHIEIRSIDLCVDDQARMQAVTSAAGAFPNCAGSLDRGIYDRPDLTWVANTPTWHFTFMYDRSFYDPDAGGYRLDAFLDEGTEEFGDYDALILWQGYPRLGVDERNQFDMYRDMPGGLEGIEDLVSCAHERGVRVWIDYNPWDTGTRREGCSDNEALAQIVAATGVDGVFMDTMPTAPVGLRQLVDQVKPGVAFSPEGHPEACWLSVCSASWAQYLTDPYPPGLLRLKWIEPRHMQNQIRRWEREHPSEIETALFNGSGMLVWENVFGTYNPWPIENRMTWRRAVAILRHFAPNFTSDSWDPFYPVQISNLYAHRWPGDGITVFTLLNLGQPIHNAYLLKVPYCANTAYFDLWTGQPLSTQIVGGNVRLIGSIEQLGCLLVIDESKVDQPLLDLLARQQSEAAKPIPPVDPRNFAESVVEPKPIAYIPPSLPRDSPPSGMVFVPSATILMHIEHVRRECGCYPDPGTPENQWDQFLWGNPYYETLQHNIGPLEVAPFFIDETEVTNAEFKRFLDQTGYTPAHPANFLKHWPGGVMPPALADYPVVYVDLDDARAYVQWAQKRLPREEEWHLAAQGTDGHIWPWGNTFDPAKCNTTGNQTLPVRSCPQGRSPYGCYHMSGNVWEWTESERDDGHTRFAIIRGGGYFNAQGSDWYVSGGPQPCNYHAKFILMWPGLDRCATVGFRCVVPVVPAPVIRLSISSLTRTVINGSNLPNDTFTVTNGGIDTLNYSISDDVSWLAVQPTSGTSTGEADTITITYNAAELAIGDYWATISVEDSNASNSPQTMAVNLKVRHSGAWADFDDDGDVDQEDFGYFQACFSGTGVIYEPGCEAADLNADKDVDLSDFDLFRMCMGGANKPPDC